MTSDRTALQAVFSGERGGVWPATNAQSNVWDWLQREDSEWISTLFTTVPVPGGMSVERVVEVLGALVSRHESLRTVYQTDAEGVVLQDVATAGTLEVRIIEAAGEDLDLVEEKAIDSFPAGFRLDREISIRAALLTEEGAPERILLQLSHIAVDRQACAILKRDLARALAGDPLPENAAATRQPVDQAIVDHSDYGRKRMAETLKYWKDQNERHPLCLMTVPRIADAGVYHLGTLVSASLGGAARTVAERCAASVPAVWIAAITAVVGTWTGNPSSLVYVTVANRAHRSLKDYLGTIAQEATVPYRLDERSFDRHVTATNSAAMRAYPHAMFDSRRLAALIEEVGFRRGVERHRDCVINIEKEDTAGLVEPADVEGVTLSEGYLYEEDLRFDVHLSGTGIRLTLNANGDFVSEQNVSNLLTAIERLLTLGAAGDADFAAVLQSADVIPPRLGPEWVNRDGSWINPTEVRSVLDELFGPGRSKLEVDTDATMTAAIPALDFARPVEETRRRFFKQSSSRHAVMIPDRFTPLDQRVSGEE